MTNKHTLINEASEHWPMLSGVALALWYAGVRLKRRLFHNYVTMEQMVQCKNEIIKAMEGIENENTRQHEHIMDTMIMHIERDKR